MNCLWDNFKKSKFTSEGYQKEKRKSKTLETYFKKIVKKNLPKFGEGNRWMCKSRKHRESQL